MLDYQLNRGCLSDLFDMKDRTGLMCSCSAQNEGLQNNTESPDVSGFLFFKKAQNIIYNQTDADQSVTYSGTEVPAENPPVAHQSLLDLESYAVFLPLVQPVLMQRFARKLIPESKAITMHPQTRPDNTIIPPQKTAG